MEKPGRPLGLSLAILISVVLFSLLPIGQVIFVLSLQRQFESIEFLEGGGAVGGSLQVSQTNLIVPVILGILFLLIAILAWRGRPPQIRFVFVAAVIIVTLVTIALSTAGVAQPADVSQGIDSGMQLTSSLMSARVLVSVLVALYVIWYVNRGPARAFFRGHYLQN
ncbi:MAG: hypothetical protein CL610_10100 [Anaerolineaceae bacterium]|nr:hypothetical protein [Anaerolineaceae bacterium]